MASLAGSDEDHAAIAALVAQEDAAWAAGDAAAFSAHVRDDIVFTNVVGMFAIGREPFETQHARIFATIYKGSRLTQKIAGLSFVRPDVAVLDTVTEVTGFAELPPGAGAVNGVLRTRLEQVLVRDDDGEWRVAAFHNVPIHPSLQQAG